MNEIRRELVLFRFRRVTAKTVAIAGILGDWHPSFASMEKCGGGIWQKYLHMCPGEHQYRLIVDGDWDATGIRTVTVPEPDRHERALSEHGWGAKKTPPSANQSATTKITSSVPWLN